MGSLGGSLGGYLRELRLAKGASLEEISRATRIGKGQLEALEAGELAELPAALFVRGFIRSYCDCLGESPDEALRRYRDIAGPTPVETRPVRSRPPRPARPWTPVLAGLVLLLLLGGALLLLRLGLSARPGPTVSVPAPSTMAPSTGPLAPAPAVEAPREATPAPAIAPAPGAPASASAPGAELSPPAPASPAASAGAQRLIVRATEPTWIKVQLDQAEPLQELLPAGAMREWTAERRFVLTVGNAGGVELELNGQRLPPLGERGAVIRELVLPRPAGPSS
ncbi:MAG: helix-turn-helix domain-containing protein [Candidatus Rokubacteria bacterium]|nr:helix-turn-helix domain-containing protein [Candidatus Rokubacteria bacterium]